MCGIFVTSLRFAKQWAPILEEGIPRLTKLLTWSFISETNGTTTRTSDLLFSDKYLSTRKHAELTQKLSFSHILSVPKRTHLCQLDSLQWSAVDTLSTLNSQNRQSPLKPNSPFRKCLTQT